jgi:hypothetical protein
MGRHNQGVYILICLDGNLLKYSSTGALPYKKGHLRIHEQYPNMRLIKTNVGLVLDF